MDARHRGVDLCCPVSVGEAMKIVDTMPTLSTTPILRRPVRITPLVSSTKDGKPYARPAHVQAKISKILSLPRSCWVEEAENLENETLVFLIRRTHGVNDDICGGLMEELRKRIVARTRRFAQNLDDFDEEQLISNVEIKVLELLLTKEASREHDFLEIAFAKKIKELALDHLKQLENSPMGHLADFVETDEEGEEVQRPIEFVPDDEPEPEETLLNLDNRIHRHRLLRKLLEAVPDRRHREAVILHYAYDYPITSTQRGRKTLKRHFRKDPRQLKYWIATAMKEMRAALKASNPDRDGSNGRSRLRQC
jgi:hypothetical protein